MSLPSTLEYEDLSTAEKILRLQDAWDCIAQKPESVEVTEPQKKELDARLDAMQDNPDENVSWEQLKAELEKR